MKTPEVPVFYTGMYTSQEFKKIRYVRKVANYIWMSRASCDYFNTTTTNQSTKTRLLTSVPQVMSGSRCAAAGSPVCPKINPKTTI